MGQYAPLSVTAGVFFLESAPTFEEACTRRATLLKTVASDSEVVIYRQSYAGSAFYLSRQIDLGQGGKQLFADEPEGTTTIGYDLFRAPRAFLTTSTTEPREPKLAAAVIAICDFGQNRPPVLGPN
jgi:hypothetical protein